MSLLELSGTSQLSIFHRFCPFALASLTLLPLLNAHLKASSIQLRPARRRPPHHFRLRVCDNISGYESATPLRLQRTRLRLRLSQTPTPAITSLIPNAHFSTCYSVKCKFRFQMILFVLDGFMECLWCNSLYTMDSLNVLHLSTDL